MDSLPTTYFTKYFLKILLLFQRTGTINVCYKKRKRSTNISHELAFLVNTSYQVYVPEHETTSSIVAMSGNTYG